MEDNFALRYVLKQPGVNSRAELIPSPRAYARGTALHAVCSGIKNDCIAMARLKLTYKGSLHLVWAKYQYFML
jgi:hypothetical protein